MDLWKKILHEGNQILEYIFILNVLIDATTPNSSDELQLIENEVKDIVKSVN